MANPQVHNIVGINSSLCKAWMIVLKICVCVRSVISQAEMLSLMYAVVTLSVRAGLIKLSAVELAALKSVQYVAIKHSVQSPTSKWTERLGVFVCSVLYKQKEGLRMAKKSE